MKSFHNATEQTVESTLARDMLRKALLKSDAVIETYNSPDTYNLPAVNTAWRLAPANAVSWIAGSTEDAETQNTSFS